MSSRHRSKSKELFRLDASCSDHFSGTESTCSSELREAVLVPSASTKGTGANSLRNKDIEDAEHPPVDLALPTLTAAVRSSRARTSALLEKASR